MSKFGLTKTIGSWSLEKYKLLRIMYLKHLEANTGRKSVCVDAFAGCGTYYLQQAEKPKKIDGSPLIAAKMKPGFDKLVFIESDKTVFDELKHNTKRFKPTLYNADAHEILPQIIPELMAKNTSVAMFLDPCSLDLPKELMHELAEIPRLDLAINFLSSFVHRTAHTEKGRNDINKLYGHSAWQQTTGKGTIQKHANQYCKVLHSIFPYVTAPMSVLNSGNRAVYHIIMASTYGK